MLKQFQSWLCSQFVILLVSIIQYDIRLPQVWPLCLHLLGTSLFHLCVVPSISFFLPCLGGCNTLRVCSRVSAFNQFPPCCRQAARCASDPNIIINAFYLFLDPLPHIHKQSQFRAAGREEDPVVVDGVKDLRDKNLLFKVFPDNRSKPTVHSRPNLNEYFMTFNFWEKR